MMQISSSRIISGPKKRSFLKLLKSNSGFTLIEILVALFLVVLLLGIVTTGGSFTQRQALDQYLDDMERSIRFSMDESVLRNSMIRVHFDLNKEPQNYAVEFGPNDSFVLPQVRYQGAAGTSLSLKEEEELEAKVKKLNKKFNKVKEFQNKNKEIENGVRLVGIGTSGSEMLMTEFQANVYIYPTGEKDDAIIIFATEEEVAAISVSAFTTSFDKIYKDRKSVV